MDDRLTALIPKLVDCVIGGTRNPQKCLGLLAARGVDLPDEATVEAVRALMETLAFHAAEKAARLEGIAYREADRLERQAKFLGKIEALAHGEDARTALTACRLGLAYDGIVETQKVQVDALDFIAKVREALKDDGDEGA